MLITPQEFIKTIILGIAMSISFKFLKRRKPMNEIERIIKL